MVCRYHYKHTVLFAAFQLSDMSRGCNRFAEIFRTKHCPEDLCARQDTEHCRSDII